MSPSRSLAAGLAALLLVPSIASAQVCVQPAEKIGFDIRALQSQLMVAALACGQQDDYNAFVRRYQNEVAGAFRSVAAHFRRTAGAQHQRQLDQYITNLANGQSQMSIARGSFFCREQAPLFQAAMTATNSAELAQVAVTLQVHQVLTTPECPARPTTTTRQASNQQPRASQQPATVTR